MLLELLHWNRVPMFCAMLDADMPTAFSRLFPGRRRRATTSGDAFFFFSAVISPHLRAPRAAASAWLLLCERESD